MRIFLVLTLGLLAGSPSFAASNCKIMDISRARSTLEKEALKIIHLDWLQTAFVCQMGKYEVAVPSDKNSKSNAIFVFRKNKPVFSNNNNGADIYSPNLKYAEIDKPVVELWYGGKSQDITRLWYQTIGKYPFVNLDDMNFDGTPDVKIVQFKDGSSKWYKWYKGHWKFLKAFKKNPND